MVLTNFTTIQTTYLNEDVTKYYVRRIDLAIDPHPIKLERNKDIRIHFGLDLMKRLPENNDLKVNLSITHIGKEKPIPCLELVSIGRIRIFIHYNVFIISSKTKLVIIIHLHYREIVK